MFTEGFPFLETRMYLFRFASSHLILLWKYPLLSSRAISRELIHEYADYYECAIPQTLLIMHRRFRAFMEIVRSDREPRINEIARKSSNCTVIVFSNRDSLQRDASQSVRISIGIIFISDSQPVIDVINAIVYNVII